MSHRWIGLLLLLLLLSCRSETGNDRGRVVATIYGKNLYETDLKDVLYPGISPNDSLVRCKAFIDGWIRRQLLLNQAENNLTLNQTDFSKQLEDYRSSLIIYTYETELIEQNLDTVVTDDDISKYYDANSSNFKLNDNIVRIASVTISQDCKKKWQFIKLLRDYDSLLIDSISSLAEKYAEGFHLNTDVWMSFDDFLNEYPLTVKDPVSFLEKNTFIKLDEDDNSHLIRICEYRKTGDVSPVEMESEAISHIILNMRKKELLGKLHDDLYTKAVKGHVFQIY